MDPKISYENASSSDWSEVLIVGGGPSAKTFDFHKFPCDQVLACNSAIFLVPLSRTWVRRAVFSQDNRWITQNRGFLSVYGGEKYVAVPLETWPECGGIPGVIHLRHGYGLGLSEDPEEIRGTNSGFGALNLAYTRGARKIYLIGFDMNTDDNDQYVYWREEFKMTLPQLKSRKIEVYNLNPNSSIKAFPVLTL